MHLIGYLSDGQAVIVEVRLHYGHGCPSDVSGYLCTRDLLDGVREILHRHVQLVGVVGQFTLCLGFASLEQSKELRGDIAYPVRHKHRLASLHLEVKQIVYHGLQETSHHLIIEVMALLRNPLADAFQVASERLGILWSDMYDGIVKEQDAALDGKVIGWKKSVEQLAGSHDILTSEVIALCQTGGQLWLVDHGYIPLSKHKRPSVIDQTSFPTRAEQVHNAASILPGVDATEVRGSNDLSQKSLFLHIHPYCLANPVPP